MSGDDICRECGSSIPTVWHSDSCSVGIAIEVDRQLGKFGSCKAMVDRQAAVFFLTYVTVRRECGLAKKKHGKGWFKVNDHEFLIAKAVPTLRQQALDKEEEARILESCIESAREAVRRLGPSGLFFWTAAQYGTAVQGPAAKAARIVATECGIGRNR
jgi:hypothetical protein